MKRANKNEDANMPVKPTAKGEARSGNRISNILPALVLNGGLLLLLFSLLQTHSVFPDAWFPSAFAALAFKVVFCMWIIGEIVNNLRSRKNSGATSKDKGSYWVVIVATYAAVFAIFVSRSFGTGTFRGTLQYAGLVLAVAGIALRQWAVLVLGRHFTVRVQVREKARLVTEGPYNYVRHPAYTGSLLTYAGLSLSIGSWLGVIFVLTVCL